ncbi:MAG: isocitrate lyase/PEP mutase family protein [Alphaproteobacteria bacterium]|nr:isocitrate lyase/PEP mutase family protein [Alphaproteobacteria bacterium]
MTLRARLARKPILIAPGVYDAMTALLAEQAGFEALYLSGASIAYARLGRPDIGLVDMGEVADTVATITDRVGLPLLVDGDTGFGNALNLRRTVRAFERAGAAAIQIEDQTLPKRCGHLRGKTLVPAAEMIGKIKAALDARRDLLVIARTDAIAVEGFDTALDRAEAYAEAGCDVLFVEAPATLDQMRSIATRFAGRLPVMANMVEGGTTPLLPAAELERLGYALAIFPGGTMRATAFALRDYFASLRSAGTTAPWRERMLDFNALNRVIGTDAMLELGRRYDTDQQGKTS